jgi:hypothetical protein
MSDCCLPNLGCLSIPVVSTNVAGIPGQNGAAGAAATIAVGTVTTVNPGDPATVTNVGTSGAAIFDFEIPEGATGGQGIAGVTRLFSNLTDNITPTINDWVTMSLYNIPANTLVNNGDALVIRVRCLKTLNSNNVLNVRYRVLFNALSCTTFGAVEPFLSSTLDTTSQYELVVEIIKKSSSTALCIVSVDLSVSVGGSGTVGTSKYQNELTGLNFAISNTLYSQLYQEVANQIRFKSVTIDKITAV